MMRSKSLIVLTLALMPIASAQAQGPGSSLGGYGGSMSRLDSGTGMSGPVIPYAGRFGGFMPARMGGGASLSFTPRGASAPGVPRASFSLSPMSGGMTSMSGDAGRRLGASGLPSFGSGLGGGMQGMPARSGSSVMPPSFASPFRPPTNLLGPASSGSGMSM